MLKTTRYRARFATCNLSLARPATWCLRTNVAAHSGPWFKGLEAHGPTRLREAIVKCLLTMSKTLTECGLHRCLDFRSHLHT